MSAALDASGSGLTSDEARRRLAEVGPNEPGDHRRAHAVVAFLLCFANPLVVTLLVAAVVSAVVGQVVDATIIALIVVLSASVNFAQSHRATRAADRLREDVTPTATVRRDGEWREIARREIVPGDVVRLGAGDRVPADARLLSSRDLYLQEAALTGESLPVEKAPRPTTWRSSRSRPTASIPSWWRDHAGGTSGSSADSCS